MTTRAAVVFQDHFGDSTGAVAARAPGRVYFLGEHTGFNDGFMLASTIDRHVEVVARQRADLQVRIAADDFGERRDQHLDQPIDYANSGWLPHVMGVVHELRQRGRIESGVDIVFRGSLSRETDLGWSAALEVATALALDAVFKLWLNPVDLVTLCREVDDRYAGGGDGTEDQFVSRLGRPDHALLIDCRSLDARHVPMPIEGHRLVIVDSGIRHEYAEAGLSRRQAECAEAVAVLRQADVSLTSLRELSPDMLSSQQSRLAPDLLARCRHVISEKQRSREACERLAAGDLAAFGRLMTASHLSLRKDFEISHPVLDRLVEKAREVEGVLGARLTGTGPGGCIVNLVTEAALPELQSRLEPLLDDWSEQSMVVGQADTARVTEVIS